MTREQFNILLEKWRSHKITPEEFLLFKTAAQDVQYNEWMAEAVYNDLEKGSFEGLISEEERVIAYERFMKKAGAPVEEDAPRVYLRQRAWLRYAAILLLIAGAAAYIYTINNGPRKQTAQTKPAEIPDIPPGGNKALLTLADGSTIVLDSAANGSLARQANVKVVKLAAGRLAYTANRINEASGKPLYNTISTPRGGQYQISLSDGTQVWLNAASSIRFPATFSGKERQVQITGEAYIEVAKDVNAPFKVLAGKSEIEVLGTAFNVNSYTDEETVKTTLLEGKVKIITPLRVKGIVLNPGQQAQQDGKGDLELVRNADVEEAIAWRKGRFQFNSADIKTIMRQMSRWYDVDVMYKGNIDLHFSGNLNRDMHASEVFEKLALTGEVQFAIEGKKVIVMNKTTAK